MTPAQCRAARALLDWSVFGYALVYHNREGADLMYRGKRLGLVRWRNNEIFFDPPLPAGESPTLSDDTFNKWLAQAEFRDAITGYSDYS